MADSPADEALGEEDSQPVEEEDCVNEGDMTCTISLVHQLKIGKNVIWYPDVQQVQGADGGLFFRLSKHDAVLTRVVLGKGLNRHKKVGAIRTLANLEFWETLRKLRREACDVALKHQLEEAAGQPVAKCRAARDDDRYLVSKSVVVKLPGVAMSRPVLWLAAYVALSRVRSLDRLRSVGLDNKIRAILEQGPPNTLPARFHVLFSDKESETQTFAKECLRLLRW